MITQETIDLIKEKMQLPVSLTDRIVAAKNILYEAASGEDRPLNEYKSRIAMSEAEQIVDAIQSESAKLILAKEREQTLLDQLDAIKLSLASSYTKVDRLIAEKHNLGKFIIDKIAYGV